MSISRRIACIRIPISRTGAPEGDERPGERGAVLAVALLAVAPRVTPVGGFPWAWWADATGIRRAGGEEAVAEALVNAAEAVGFPEARVGIADRCVAAAAATWEAGVRWRVVPPGGDAAFLRGLSLHRLPLARELRDALNALGLSTCAELAALPAADLELRWGAAGLRAWRLAQGIDPRWPFRPPVPEHVSAEAEFEPGIDTLEPLRFVLRGLLTSVLAQLAERQRLPASLRLALRLEGGAEEARPVRPARATGDERALGDLCRLALEGTVLAAPVVGVRLDVAEEGAAEADQLDAFRPPAPDPGAVHAALLPVLARWGEGALCRAVPRGAHPPDRRALWEPVGIAGLRGLGRQREGERAASPEDPGGGRLLLGLCRFPEPLPLRVTTDREGRPTALRLEDTAPPANPTPVLPAGGCRVEAEGPNWISSEWWDEGYARAFWWVEDAHGRFWLLAHEARADAWALQGWYD